MSGTSSDVASVSIAGDEEIELAAPPCSDSASVIVVLDGNDRVEADLDCGARDGGRSEAGGIDASITSYGLKATLDAPVGTAFADTDGDMIALWSKAPGDPDPPATAHIGPRALLENAREAESLHATTHCGLTTVSTVLEVRG